MYNLGQDSLSWFTSYLSNRTQQVKYKSKLSEPLHVTYGVPQGSILGPLLFLIFINDLPLRLLEGLTQLSRFADDATYFVSNKNVKTINFFLQICSNSIQSWCRSNHMVTNVDKTKVMLSSTCQNLFSMNDHDKNLNVFPNGNKLEQVTSEKLLGVTIDESLFWKQQIKVIERTITYKISLLRRIKKYIPVRKPFYNYYIIPYFKYCCSVWGNCSQTDINTMTKLQKIAARLILD